MEAGMKAMSKVNPQVHAVIDGVNVVTAEALMEALYGKDWSLTDYQASTVHITAWVKRHGAHYYAAERWAFDEDDRMYPDFSIDKGVREAKRYGRQIVVVEDLS